MSVIHLWRGPHGAAFRSLFEACWARGELLIACPPARVDLSFAAALPAGEVRLAGDWPAPSAVLPARPAPPAYPERPVLGVFTTGTTRAGQKLVLYSRANIAASQGAIFALFDARRVEQIFCYPQPYHVFGLLLGYALAALRGVRLVAPEGPYGRRAHELWLAQPTGASLTLATPSHMQDLCAFLAASGARPRPTYACILGGARVDRAVWAQARAVAAIEQPSVGYGCTEASPGISHLPPGVAPDADGDVGWPLPHVELDLDGPGGVLLRGPAVCLATIEDGALSLPAAHLVPDELRRGEGGRLTFVGRRDVVLNRGGEKFPLEHIEAVLRERLGLEAICCAVPDARLGSELGIVARAGRPVAAGEIYATLAAVYQRPFNAAHLRYVDELPLNANAKPDRNAAVTLLVSC